MTIPMMSKVVMPEELGEVLRMAVKFAKSPYAATNEMQTCRRLVRRFVPLLLPSDLFALLGVLPAQHEYGPEWDVLRTDIELLVMFPAEGGTDGENAHVGG